MSLGKTHWWQPIKGEDSSKVDHQERGWWQCLYHKINIFTWGAYAPYAPCMGTPLEGPATDKARFSL